MFSGVIILVASLLLLLPLPVLAQSSGETVTDPAGSLEALPADLTQDQLNSLIARMSDTAVRQLLLDRLAADVAAAPVAVPSKPDERNIIEIAIDTIGVAASQTFQVMSNSGGTLTSIWAALADSAAAMGTSGGISFLGMIALVIALGAIAEVALNRLLKGWRMQRTPDASMRVAQKLGWSAKLFLHDTIGLLVFFLVVSVAMLVLMPEEYKPIARVLVIWLVILPRFCGAVLRFFFAPRQSGGLEVYSADWTRRYLYRNLYRMVIACGIALALVKFIEVTGTKVSGAGFWINLMIFVWLAGTIIHARKGITALVRGRSSEPTATEEWVARAYPLYAVGLVIFTWAFSMVGITIGLDAYVRAGAHLATLALLLAVPLFEAGVRSTVVQLMRPMEGEGLVAEAARAATVSANIRIARVLILAATITVVGRLWGVRLLDLATSTVGDRFGGRIIVFVYILLAGYLVWEITRLLINRKLAKEFTASQGMPMDEDAIGIGLPMGSSRLATVLPIFSMIVQTAIIVVTLLMALSNLGIDVTALIAGAGIFGLAIGFGSQKLVSDIVSGMFFLMDDAFRIGEYVDVGDVGGTIEKFSLRSMQLRDAKGPLFCVPYSEIPKVKNSSRDWGIMKIPFSLDYGTDVEKVRKILKKIGLEMLENPALKDGFIEPFKSQGVREIKDGYVVIGSKFTHKPGAQFMIRKEIYRLVQRDFELNGIKFYRPEVRVLAEPGAAGQNAPAVAAATLLASKAAEVPKA